jgi:hypothetical protein
MKWIEQHKDYQGDDCLSWPFGKANKGYGLIRTDGGNTLASRYMCTVAHGEPLDQSLHAAHSCHNGHLGCVNPKHLTWQTRDENNQIRPRARKGSASHFAKLSEGDVSEMRRLYEAKLFTQEKLAEIYGINVATANSALKRKTWRHVQ